jgi:hypothetical protein
MADESWMESSLRLELDRITTELVGDRRDEQIAAIDRLRGQFPHSIALVERADPQRLFNCYQDAFDLRHIRPPIALISMVHEEVFPNRKFARYLVERNLTLVGDDGQDGDVLVWSTAGTINHAGKAAGAGAISKWGPPGHQWKHGLMEVPASYGADVGRFRPILRDDALAAFVAFARHELGDDAVDDLIGPDEKPTPTSTG